MDERSALASALSGRSEIDREIGRGGMATVYLHSTFGFSRDGKHLIGRDRSAAPARMLAIPLDGRAPRQILSEEIVPGYPEVSPDGKWMVYAAGDPTHREIYVANFPGGGNRVQVSSTGAFNPTWSFDGRQVYYQLGNSMRAVSLRFDAGAPSIVRSDSLFGGVFRDFTANPKGKGFVVLRESGEGRRWWW